MSITKLVARRVIEKDSKGGVYLLKTKGIIYDNVFSDETGAVVKNHLRVLLKYNGGSFEILAGDKDAEIDKSVKKMLRRLVEIERDKIFKKAIQESMKKEIKFIKNDNNHIVTEIFVRSGKGIAANVEVILYNKELDTSSLYIIELTLPRYKDTGWQLSKLVLKNTQELNLDLNTKDTIKYNDKVYKRYIKTYEEMKRPYIISIEGVDGVGKQTQTKLLKTYLESIGKKVYSVSFPRYGNPMSKGVEKYMQGDYSKDVNSSINNSQAAILYAIDRMDWALDSYNELKNEYDFIILDRYTGSNMIHQSRNLLSNDKEIDNAKMIKLAEYYEKFEYEDLKIPRPDITLFLNMEEDIVIESIKNRTEEGGAKLKKDILESNYIFVKKSIGVGNIIANHFKWSIVQCSKIGERICKNEVFNEILLKLVEKNII